MVIAFSSKKKVKKTEITAHVGDIHKSVGVCMMAHKEMRERDGRNIYSIRKHKHTHLYRRRYRYIYTHTHTLCV